FGDYEGGRTRQGTTINSVVPTAPSLNGDFTGGRPIFDPLTTAVSGSSFSRAPFSGNVIPANRIASPAAYFQSMFPTPNSGSNRYIYSPGPSLDTDKFDIKVSPRINDKNSIVSRYSFANNTETDPAAYPALGYYPLRSRSQNVGLSFLHVFAPTV